jgi:hypothetical protein
MEHWHAQPAVYFFLPNAMQNEKSVMISVYLLLICFRACYNIIYSDGLQNIQDQFIHCIQI